MIRDGAVEDAVKNTCERYGLKVSVLEPARRDDSHFGNITGKWLVGSLVIQIVSDRGQWFAGVSTISHEQSFEVSDIAMLLGLERTSLDPPQSLYPVIELVADNFASIEVLFSEPRIQQTKRELEEIAARRDEEIKNRLEAIAAGAAATRSQKPS